MSNEAREKIIQLILQKPIVAHQVFFHHRHPNVSPDFHATMIADYYTNHPRVLHLAFRGSAKSTLAEEALTLLANATLIRNAVIMGVSESRAKERLQAVKFELEQNADLIEVFGDQVGPTWSETKIVLRNGVCLQALGRDQSLRGAKHLDARPDFLLLDDIEDESSVLTPESRLKLAKHITSVVIPSLTPPGTNRIRMTATPLDFDALAVRFSKDPAWLTRKYPIRVIDFEESARTGTKVYRSTWPERFPLEEIAKTQEEFRALGQATGFSREYLLEVMAEEDQQFKSEYIKVEPMRRSFHAVYAVYDPARTTNEATSSRTGKFVFSWIGNRLIVWESGGYFWKPDELIDDIFATDEKYNTVAIGVEQDGLHEFIFQPLRTQQIERGRPVPIRALKAPKGKDGFIRGLQPFFKAGEVILAQDLLLHDSPDATRNSHKILIDELLTFPTGRKDTINAAAFALVMRPGLPVFDNFNENHIYPTQFKAFQPTYFAVNSTNIHTTLAVCQFYNGQLHVLNDWVADGDAGTVLKDILKSAALTLPAQSPYSHASMLSNLSTTRARLQNVKAFAPPEHFSNYDTIGLRAACSHIPLALMQGGEVHRGREELRALLSQSSHGISCVRVNPQATWTLRALSGGYARDLDAAGRPKDEPAENVYATLMSGVCALLANTVHIGSVDADRNFAYTEAGHQYLTSRPKR